MTALFNRGTANEKTKILAGYTHLLARLYHNAAQELTQRQADQLVVAALVDTPIAGAILTADGFADDEETQAILGHLPSMAKRQAYQQAITAFVAQLFELLPEDHVNQLLKNTIQTICRQHELQTSDFAFLKQTPQTPLSIWLRLRARLQRRFAVPTPSIARQPQLTFDRKSLKTILAYIDEGVIIVDENHKILFANQKVAELTDFAEAEIIGQYLPTVLQLANETSTISDMIYLPNLYDTSKTIFYVGKNLKLTSVFNRTHYVDLHIERLNADENNGQFVLLIRPVAASFAMQSNQHDLFSIMAHELRTPLTSLRGYLAILQDAINDTADTDQRVMLGRMAIAANELLGIVENILALNKIENKTFNLQLERFRFSDVIEKVIAQLEPMAQAKKIVITYEKPSDVVPTLVADKLRVVEVLTNLVTNAIKFTPIGGQIWIRVYQEASAIRTEVCDNGIGIDEHVIPKLFNKYVQVAATNQGNTGSGLGLYIAKEIISAHHGEIWVHSAKDKGSTFAFRIPLDLVANMGNNPQARKKFTSNGHTLEMVN